MRTPDDVPEDQVVGLAGMPQEDECIFLQLILWNILTDFLTGYQSNGVHADLWYFGIFSAREYNSSLLYQDFS